MGIELGTLFFVLVVTSVLQAFAVLIQYRINRSVPGLGLWAIGFVCGAIAFCLLFIRGFITTPISFIILGNMLFMTGAVSIYVGCLRFLTKKPNWKLVGLIFSLFFAGLVYYTYINNDINYRTSVISFSLSLVFFLTALGLYRNKPDSIRMAANIIAAVLFFHAGFHAFRAVAVITILPVQALFYSTALTVSTYLIQLIQGIILTFGLVIMVNQRLNAEIKEGKERFELLFMTSPDAVLITTLSEGVIVEVNDGFVALSGYSRCESVGRTVIELNIWADQSKRAKLVEHIKENSTCENIEIAYRRKDGTIAIGMTSTKVFDYDGRRCIMSVTRDITELRNAMTAMIHQAKVQEVLLKIAEATLLSTSLNELYETVHRLLGQVVPAKNFYLALRDESIRQIVVPYCVDETGTVPRQRPIGKGLTEYVMRQGQPVHVTAETFEQLLRLGEVDKARTRIDEYLGVPLIDSEGKAYGVLAFNLINETKTFSKEEIDAISIIAAQVSLAIERKQSVEELQRQAVIDGLTGIFNRRHFLERVEEELLRIRRFGGTCTMLMLDIDHFKQVNDLFGHTVGDEALKHVTKICVTCLRNVDLIGRVGGEEFAILLLETNVMEGQQIADRLRQSIAENEFITEQRKRIPLRVSIGVAEYLGKEETLTQLMTRADNGLYQAKRTGRNRVSVVC